ncbi:uncharacterized protein LOC130666603 isoform X1 [Microplitis mediator]|uniref:uncharacterized protein LOC130666603 isoform X1 n=1 Tax=Microplitis mediator TaxID=375433 RepID=UPI002556FA8B|nr:uncharacterized protein LOC130666603 isoform X1 [Microplitis mediator]
MAELGQFLYSRKEMSKEKKAEQQLLRTCRFHGKIGDRNSYWANPVFATPASYLNFDIPVTTEITLAAGFHRRLSNVLVYHEKNSVLTMPEEPVITSVQTPDIPIPSIKVKCQMMIGRDPKFVDSNLCNMLSQAEWRETVEKIAESMAPKSTRTIATQTIETRLAPVPEPGCLKCKEKGHSHDKCQNELRGDCYCTNCRRLGHTNNTCPYQHWNTDGYREMTGYCRHCSTQYPFVNDSCQTCRTRVEMTQAARGAYQILPP